jgi:hypothetical protein
MNPFSSKKTVPYPISNYSNTGISSSTIKKKEVSLYYSKFLAIYYIDLIYNFIDVIVTCCIGILDSHISYMGYIKAHVLFNSTIVSKLIELNKKIAKERYVYVEEHYEIIDVDAEKEVLAINFLERKRELSDFINGNYYRELYNVINKRNTVQTQYTNITYILNKREFNDDIKKQKIQEYIDKTNKKIASNIYSRLNFIPLESIEKKLKSIERVIVALESCFSNNWSVNGKQSFDDYKIYKIERQEIKGGKRNKKRNKTIIKGSGLGNFFSRFTSTKVAPIHVDYIATVNKYKSNQTEKLKELYNFIEEIVLYILEHIKRAHIEYDYLNKHNSRYIKNENKGFRPIKLNNIESDYLEMSNSRLVYNINHEFKILKGRYTEFEKILSMSFSDEQII